MENLLLASKLLWTLRNVTVGQFLEVFLEVTKTWVGFTVQVFELFHGREGFLQFHGVVFIEQKELFLMVEVNMVDLAHQTVEEDMMLEILSQSLYQLGRHGSNYLVIHTLDVFQEFH